MESKKMGEIYENAHFTIAASSAKNSTQSLFKVRNELNLVELPHHRLGGSSAGGLLAYIQPDVEKCLSSAPLNQRVWIMKEYILSRRLVNFTSNGLLWSCKNGKSPRTRYMTSEFGEIWDKVFENDWTSLVCNYTQRDLTYKSDKFAARTGLADQFIPRKGGDWDAYQSGLWEKDLPHDFFWFSEERLLRDTPRLGINFFFC
jgi:hypothetical protein